MGTPAITLAATDVERAIAFGLDPHVGRADSRQAAKPSPCFERKAHLSKVAAALMLIPCVFVLPPLMLIVRLTSKGPAIYCQERVGKSGKTFLMFKLRTMRHDAEASTGPVWASNHDPRITRVGRILRWLHLDELPQLWNVVRGEMDLVGPRPERPEFAVVLEKQIPGYRQRLAVRPGITGLAQVNQGPDESLASVRRKLVFDLAYIENASIGLDLRIIFNTSLRLVGIRQHGPMHLSWPRTSLGHTS